MRTYGLVACLTLAACGAPLPPVPPGPVEPELVFPAEYAASTEVIAYAEFDAGQASELTEVTYALGDEYPRDVVLQPTGGYAMGAGCRFDYGSLTWTSLVSVEGTAATVSLEAGRLHVGLVAEGTVSVLLSGAVDTQSCTALAGSALTTVPLQHRLTLRVHRAVSVLVDQLHQRWPECETQVVLPANSALWVPRAHLVNAAGQQFSAANAPTPLEVTLRSKGTLTLSGREVMAAPGQVSISVNTSLPVRGLSSFEVVGPETVNSVQAELFLRKAASKGNVSEPLVDDRSYLLWNPEEFNSVDVRVSAVQTSQGRLCAPVPAEWFQAVSSTPAQCAPLSEGERSGADVPVAKVLSAGECRVEITMPGTSQRWTTRFTTTR
ncbi:MAG: hypothetical protein Q8S42_14215 [Archangium sp.]|nr:hypothetical protein [Archangium sp.]